MVSQSQAALSQRVQLWSVCHPVSYMPSALKATSLPISQLPAHLWHGLWVKDCWCLHNHLSPSKHSYVTGLFIQLSDSSHQQAPPSPRQPILA